MGAASNILNGPTLRIDPTPRAQEGNPKAALCHRVLITSLERVLEVEAQTRAGRGADAVAPNIDA